MLSNTIEPIILLDRGNIDSINYISNRYIINSLNRKTPYEAWTGKKLYVSHIREFRCKVYWLNRKPGSVMLAS